MRFLFVTMDFGGNVPPALGLVRRLVSRGHTVNVLADRPLRTRIELAGGAFRAVPSALEWDEAKGRAAEDNVDFFLGQRDDPPLAEAVLAEQTHDPADVLVVDCMLRNALAAAEAIERPFAVLLHYRYGWLFEGPADRKGWESVRNRVNETRRRVGVTALTSSLEEPPSVQSWQASDRVLALLPREFERPGLALPPKIRYVGPVFEERPQVDWDSPWPRDHPDPLVVVSLGTTYMHHETVVQRVLDALESLPVRTLLTLGSGLRREEVRVPTRAVSRRFVPHVAVLPHSALVVTHAGMGTINVAFAHGVPMLCLPFGRDQVGNASRVEELGAGRMLNRDAPVERVRSAISEILMDGQLRGGARHMAEVVAAYRDGAVAISELEGLRKASRSHEVVGREE